MSDIRNQLIKDSFDYVLQSDLSTGIVYRIGGDIPINPTFLSGLTINSGFTYSNGTEINGYVLTCDSNGNANWGPVSGASGNFLSLSGGTVFGNTTFTSGLSVNYIDFDTTPTVPSPTGGTLYYDSNENALSYKPITPSNDVTVNLGQESLVRIYNNLGVQINNGQALHITGAISGTPTVSLAIGTGGDAVQFQISGIATHDIPNGSFGFMTVFGVVRDINLTGFSIGEQVYLSQHVAGGFASYSDLFYTGRTCEVGHVLDNSSNGKLQVTILNEIEGTIITTQENNILAANNSSTGVFQFGGLSIDNPSGTTFSVGEVEGWIIDNVTAPANPTIQLIIYSGSTGNTSLYYSTATETYVLLTSASTITQQTSFPTPQQRRQNIYLGKFGHGNKQFLINTFNEPDSVLSPLSQLRDMFTSIKLINDGVIPSDNGANLTFNTSAGTLYGLGIGYITNKLNPNSLTINSQSPTTFQYRTRTGGTASNTTVIDPSNKDVNGVITPITGVKATNQRIYLLQNGQIRIQYGQQEYNQLAAAVAALQNETFVTFPNFRDNGILIGILSVLSSCTELNDTSKAQFFSVSKFGELIGAAGGTSTTTLQQAYNNSSNPEITINSTLDGLSIKNGTISGDSVTNLIEGVNSSNVVTSFIRADGAFSGTSIFGNTLNIGGNTSLQGLTATTISASTYSNLPVSSVTGGTGISASTSNGVVTVTNTSPDRTVTITGGTNIQIAGTYPNFGVNYTGQTSFPYLPLSGGTVTGSTSFTGGLIANTISASTYNNLPNTLYTGNGTLSSPRTVNQNELSLTFTGTTASTLSILEKFKQGAPSNNPSGILSHAQGLSTTASGAYSHSEGVSSGAIGIYSHAEGSSTAFGTGSHSEGNSTIANGSYSHSEGEQTQSNGSYSHSEGHFSRSPGSHSHAEGSYNDSNGNYSHAEGFNTDSNGEYSHSEGYYTNSVGLYSHSEGAGYFIDGSNTFEPLVNNPLTYFRIDVSGVTYESYSGDWLDESTIRIIGDWSSIPDGSIVSRLIFNSFDVNLCYYGPYYIDKAIFDSGAGESNVIFTNNWSGVILSSVTGCTNISNGIGSHSEGLSTRANGNYSHSEGIGTHADGEGQHASGKYNLTGNTNSLFVIGNGTDDFNRSDILNVNQNEVNVFGNLNAPFISGNTFDLQYTTLSSTSSGFIDYLTVISKETNYGVSVALTPNGNPSGYGYAFQFAANNIANSLLFVGDNLTKAHYIHTDSTNVSAEGWPLIFGVTPQNDNWDANSNLLVLTSGQTIGIGVRNPTNKLHISGSTNPIRIQGLTGSTTDNLILSIDSTGVVHTYPLSGLTGGTSSGTFTGGTVSGPTNFTGGLTANTISASTYSNLPVSSVTGGTGISASTNNGVVTITNTSPDQTITISGGTGIQIVSAYPNFGVNFTGSTGTSFTGGTVTGATNFTNGLTANTISASTYYNISNYNSGVIVNSDLWINNNDGTMTFPTTQVALYSNTAFTGSVEVYTVSGQTTGVGIPALSNEDTNYIVIDYNNGTPVYDVLTDDSTINSSNIVLYLIVYRANNFVHVLDFGNEGAGLPNKLNDRIIYTDRFAREDGFSLGLSGTTGVVTLSSGVAWNGTNRQTLVAVNSTDDVFFQSFHSGGTWTYTTTSNTLNNLFYDNGTDRIAGTAGKYLVNWYFRGQEINDHLYEVWGNDEYDNVSEAQLSLEPNLPELITSHAFLTGRIIVQVSALTGTVESAFAQVFQPSTVQSHNDLTGIQGGTGGEYYHLTSSEYNNVAYENVSNTFTSGQIFNAGLTANTISGGTIYGDGSNLTNVVNSITTSTGLSGSSTNGNITLINTSPDQTVTISGGTNIQITGTYPNFGVNFTGTTGSGGTFTGGTVPGETYFAAGLTANTLVVTATTNPVQFVGLQPSTDTDIITTDGTGVLHTRSLNSVGIITWSTITSSQTGVTNNGYITNSGSQVIITLPSTASVGSIIEVVGIGAGGWKIAQESNHQIHFGIVNSTSGATGYVQSTQTYDAIKLLCTTTNNEYTVLSAIGNIDIN
jgi:hypothetical protein